VAASIPLSADSLRTDGASGASDGGTFCAGAAGAGAAGLAGADGAAALVGAGAGFPPDPAAPSVICPSNAPTATVSPSWRRFRQACPRKAPGLQS